MRVFNKGSAPRPETSAISPIVLTGNTEFIIIFMDGGVNESSIFQVLQVQPDNGKFNIVIHVRRGCVWILLTKQFVRKMKYRENLRSSCEAFNCSLVRWVCWLMIVQ